MKSFKIPFTRHWRLAFVSLLIILHSFIESSDGKSDAVCHNIKCDDSKNSILCQLLKGYDKRIRPEFSGPPLQISVEMLLSNVFDVSEVRNEFAVEIYLRQFWNDPRLRLTDHNYTKPIFLNSESINELWIPSTYFVRSKRAYLHDITTKNVLFRISPNGDVFYSQRISVVASCIMDLRYFPHDIQKCKLAMESYAYQDNDIIYSWGEDMNDYFNRIKDYLFDVPSFKLNKVSLKEGRNKYSIGSHAYLLATFIFQRRVGFFLIETYIPSCIVVIISWVSFWIPAESSPARVSLGITTVLTMTTISSSARQSLPKVSYVKVIDWFLLVCLVFVFGALLEYAFVVHYNMAFNGKQSTDSKQNKDDRMTNQKSSLTAHMPYSEDEDHCVSKENGFTSWPAFLDSHDDEKPKHNKYKRLLKYFAVLPGKIDSLARRGFPLAFIAFICIYWLKVSLSAK